MEDYQLLFPETLDGYEFEVEAKGWLPEVKVVAGRQVYRLTIYDRLRLVQDLDCEFPDPGFFAVANLLVVAEVNRMAVASAVRELADVGFEGLVPEMSSSDGDRLR